MSKRRQKKSTGTDKAMVRGKKDKADDRNQPKLTFEKKAGKNSAVSGSNSDSEAVADLPAEVQGLYQYPQSADNILESDNDWDLARLRTTTTMFKDCAGNKLWEFWNHVDYTDHWSYICTKYDANFINPPNHKTFEEFEEFAADLIERADHNWTKLDKQVNRILDYTKTADEGTPQAETDWKIREFLFGISSHDPCIMLGLDDETHPGKLHNSYWDKTTESNPELILKNRPLTALFLLASAKFDFPWAAADQNTIPQVYQDLQDEMEALRACNQKKARALVLQNKKWSQDADSSDTHDSEINVVEASPVKTTTPTRQKAPSSTKTAQKKVGFGKPKATTTPLSKPKPKPKGSNSSKKSSTTAATSSAKSNSSATGQFKPQTYKEATQLPPEVLTDKQLMTKLVQTDMNGFPWETVIIFNITASVPWKGTEREPNVSIEDRMAAKLRSAIATAMRDSPHNLALLPIDDYACKMSTTWLKNPAVLETKLNSWEGVKPFTDPSGVSNLHWFGKNPEKARPRVLRTRMRFGCNCPVDVMRPFLNYVFQVQADGSCYDTVLPAFGKIMLPGCFPYYSKDTNVRELSKFIMRELDWNIPIEFVLKWPADPGQDQDRKWVLGDDPKYWHIVTTWEHGAYVGDRMAELFSLVHNVPKHRYPWGSPCQYIHDAKMARQGYLNLPSQSESVKLAIGHQLDTAKAFLAISETLRCPHKLTGIFNQAQLSQFGEVDGDGNKFPQSLLKLLWSIKCTPEQAAQAAATADQGTTGTNVDTDDISVEAEEPSTITASTSSFGKRQRTEKEIQMMKKAQSKLMARDLARLVPSALFTHIIPSEETGIWLFVVRKKYAALARQVLKDLPAFLIFHLMEDTIEEEDAIFKKWMDMAPVDASCARGMVWDPTRLMATSWTWTKA